MTWESPLCHRTLLDLPPPRRRPHQRGSGPGMERWCCPGASRRRWLPRVSQRSSGPLALGIRSASGHRIPRSRCIPRNGWTPSCWLV